MSNMHPYHSWAGQDPSSPWPHSPPPSILGALPYPTVSHATTLVTYYITSSSHILNSKVIGPDGRTYFTISPEREMPGYTVIKDLTRNSSIALVEWKSPPEIEIPGLLVKQPIRNWLRLSPDRSARAMEVRGVRYIWTPHNQAINLHAGDLNRTFLANVSTTQNSIAIQITSEAIAQRLLESVIIATVLLQCGRNID